jgi:hypothetical protein
VPDAEPRNLRTLSGGERGSLLDETELRLAREKARENFEQDVQAFPVDSTADVQHERALAETLKNVICPVARIGRRRKLWGYAIRRVDQP